MAKIKRICSLLDVPAILPSIVVAAVHFKLSVMVEPRANEIFQRMFDMGEQPTGADAGLYSINNFLTTPIPTILLAGHPSRPLGFGWYFATAVNSVIWGALIYACYRLSSWFFKQLNVIS